MEKNADNHRWILFISLAFFLIENQVEYKIWTSLDEKISTSLIENHKYAVSNAIELIGLCLDGKKDRNTENNCKIARIKYAQVMEGMPKNHIDQLVKSENYGLMEIDLKGRLKLLDEKLNKNIESNDALNKEFIGFDLTSFSSFKHLLILYIVLMVGWSVFMACLFKKIANREAGSQQ